MNTSWRAILFAAAIALVGAGCDGCSEDEGQGDNSASNAQANAEANNDTCLLSTDCPSGICQGGVCQPAEEGCEEPGQCGNCDDLCRRQGTGGTNDPFDLENDPDDVETGNGVVVDEDGAITLDITKVEGQYIWIANTGQGTVSKVDTRTYEELGRYYTGPDGGSNDPSRTSVNTFGDVYVGNRSAGTVSKISALGPECPDQNGDGVVNTSTGPDDIKPWGEDECVLWNTDLNVGRIRAVAAQDVIPGTEMIDSAVWVGDWNTATVFKLDGETGAVRFSTPAPTATYGFALDGLGNLWISGWSSGQRLGRVDTTKCVDEASCNVETCVGEGAMQDACVKQAIVMPAQPYGITVDYKQRVWMGGNGATMRYNPTAAPGSRITSVNVPFNHGIAADDQGWVWGAAKGSGIYRYEADNPSNYIEVPGTLQDPKGMAIDLDGKVWAINQNTADATVIVPGAGINDNMVQSGIVPQIIAPYTYSDMTGAQLRFVTDERGFYRRIFEGCEKPRYLQTNWQELRWDAEVPEGAAINFRVRGAQTKEALANATWHDVATVPPDTSPFDLATALEAVGLETAQWIEIEAGLRAVRDTEDNVLAPRLLAIDITMQCPPNVQ